MRDANRSTFLQVFSKENSEICLVLAVQTSTLAQSEVHILRPESLQMPVDNTCNKILCHA